MTYNYKFYRDEKTGRIYQVDEVELKYKIVNGANIWIDLEDKEIAMRLN